MRKLLSIIGIAFLLSACVPTRPESTGVDSNAMPVPGMEGVEEHIVSSDESGDAMMTSEDSDGDGAMMQSERTIEMTAENFAFTPSAITVKQGEKVTLRITGKTGVHGIKIPDLGINQSIDLGSTVTIELPTDKAGAFAFSCSVPCGSGHKDMKGTITVE